MTRNIDDLMQPDVLKQLIRQHRIINHKTLKDSKAIALLADSVYERLESSVSLNEKEQDNLIDDAVTLLNSIDRDIA